MKNKDHVILIQSSISKKSGVWADLGSGTGAFTLALRECAGPQIKIYSIDIDDAALKEQKKQMDRVYPDTKISYMVADFTKDLSLPLLDGIIMANSIHFVKDKAVLLRTLGTYLKPHGKLIIVEYNTDEGNEWVPYSLSFTSFKRLAIKAGYKNVNLLKTIPSKFLDEIYSAEAFGENPRS